VFWEAFPKTDRADFSVTGKFRNSGRNITFLTGASQHRNLCSKSSTTSFHSSNKSFPILSPSPNYSISHNELVRQKVACASRFVTPVLLARLLDKWKLNINIAQPMWPFYTAGELPTRSIALVQSVYDANAMLLFGSAAPTALSVERSALEDYQSGTFG
jgi:hypothetical protein